MTKPEKGEFAHDLLFSGPFGLRISPFLGIWVFGYFVIHPVIGLVRNAGWRSPPHGNFLHAAPSGP